MASRASRGWPGHYPLPLDDSTVTGHAMLSKQVVQFAPMRGNPATPAASVRFARNFTYNSMLSAPMVRGDKVIGAIATARREPRAFDAKQVALIKAFADQAVIAIENARLFDEVQARTRELARSVEELRALGEVSQAVNSTLDLETALNTIVAKAVQLSNTDAGVIYVFDELDQALRVRATYGLSDELVAAIRGQPAGASDAFPDNHWRSQTSATSRQAQCESLGGLEVEDRFVVGRRLHPRSSLEMTSEQAGAGGECRHRGPHCLRAGRHRASGHVSSGSPSSKARSRRLDRISRTEGYGVVIALTANECAIWATSFGG
jgi:hypothetical protein